MPEVVAIPLDDARQAFAELTLALGGRDRARAFVHELAREARTERRRS